MTDSHMAEVDPNLAPGIDAEPGEPAPIVFGPRFLLELADEVWRLARRAERLGRLVGPEPVRGVTDSAARLRQVLEEEQVTFEDHTGEPFREHMSMKVVQVIGDVVDDDEQLWIEDTIKPMVRVRGLAIRPSHVILSARPGCATEGGDR
jgi:hypothetical protein